MPHVEMNATNICHCHNKDILLQTLVNKQLCIKVKVRSYIARYPVHRTAQSALHFTPWQTCSFQGHLNFFGKYTGLTPKTGSKLSSVYLMNIPFSERLIVNF